MSWDLLEGKVSESHLRAGDNKEPLTFIVYIVAWRFCMECSPQNSESRELWGVVSKLEGLSNYAYLQPLSRSDPTVDQRIIQLLVLLVMCVRKICEVKILTHLVWSLVCHGHPRPRHVTGTTSFIAVVTSPATVANFK